MLALADIHEASDDIAHHVMQKRVCGEIEQEIGAARAYSCALDEPHRSLRLALRGPKAGEIMLSDQEIDGFAHPLQVERQMKPPGAPREQRRPHRVVVENIAVASRQCRVARVKIPGYR